MPTWYLVDDGAEMPRWCELHGGDWIDFKARRIPVELGRPLAHVSGDTMHVILTDVPEAVADLERSFAFERLLDPWSDQGWIDRNGRFYGNAFFRHDDLAYALLRRHPAALENEGWIRVHSDTYQSGRGSVGRMTRRQQKTLLDLGFSDTEYGFNTRRTFSVDRDGPPPRYAVTPPAGTEPRHLAPKAASPDGRNGIDRLVERLKADTFIAPLFASEPEIIPDVGPGDWDWMLRWDGLDIGGEDAARLATSEGFHLHATSFDTVELTEWPFPQTACDARTALLIERAVPGGQARP